MPLLTLENGLIKQQDKEKLSYWHKLMPVRNPCQSWIKSEGFFLTSQAYPIQKDWDDIVAHLPKAGMVTNGMFYPLQTKVRLDEFEEDEDGRYRWFTPCVSDEQPGSSNALNGSWDFRWHGLRPILRFGRAINAANLLI